MFNLKIEQAKHAIKAGRLDEAGRLLAEDAVKDLRDAQPLASKLAQKLVERGNEHLAAGRHTVALQDARAAHRLGGNDPAVQALMQASLAAQSEQAQTHSTKALARQAAERCLQAGMLSACGQQLEALDAADAARLQQDIAFRRETAARSFTQGQEAVRRGAWSQAVACIQQAETSVGPSNERAALIDQLTEAAMAHVHQQLVTGEVEQAAEVLSTVQPVMADPMPAMRLRKAVHQLGQAASWLRQGKPQQALPVLQRLEGRLPKADWLKQLVKQTRQAAEAYAAIDAGPMGELGVVAIGKLSSVGLRQTQPNQTDQGIPSTRLFDKQAANHDHGSLLTTPDVFPGVEEPHQRVYILETQSADTSWIALGETVSMGPISGKQPVDLGLVADPLVPTVRFVCDEGDWFIHSEQSVDINGSPPNPPSPRKQSLLQHGDKIALSPRCRVRFTKPHAASASAVLELIQGRLARPDIRRIVLAADAVVIGNTQTAHIASADATEPVVLRCKHQSNATPELCLGSDQAAVAGDAPILKGERLPVAKAINIGGLSLRLTAVS